MRSAASTSPCLKRVTCSLTCGPTTCVWTHTPPVPPSLEERKDQVVVAGVELETGLLDDPPGVLEVVPRLLDRDDVGDLRQLREGLDGDEVHHPRRDVVVDDRLVRDGRDRLHVLDDSSRRRLVVVRRHDQEPVDAELVRPLRQVDGVAGVVGAGARDDRRAVADGLDRGGVEPEALVVRQRRRLACRPGDDEAVGTVLHEERHELAELLDADRAVGVERRDAGGQDFAEHASILLPGRGESCLEGRLRIGAEDGEDDALERTTARTNGPSRP